MSQGDEEMYGDFTANIPRTYPGAGQRDTAKDRRPQATLLDMHPKQDYLFYKPFFFDPGPTKAPAGNIESKLAYGSQIPRMPQTDTRYAQFPATDKMQRYENPLKKDGKSQGQQINLMYIAEDGTKYQMSIMAQPQNREKAVYTLLCGLYGMMMADSQIGNAKEYGKQDIKTSYN